jgi:hypothetical protein
VADLLSNAVAFPSGRFIAVSEYLACQNTYPATDLSSVIGIGPDDWDFSPFPPSHRDPRRPWARYATQARPWSVYFCSDNTYLQEQIAILSRELAEARYEIATRDQEAAFVRAPSPSTTIY